jgi:hypothetical protein
MELYGLKDFFPATLWLLTACVLGFTYFLCWLALVASALDDERKSYLLKAGQLSETFISRWLRYPMAWVVPRWPYLNIPTDQAPPGGAIPLMLGINFILQTCAASLLLGEVVDLFQ